MNMSELTKSVASSTGATETATWIEARRSDGQDVDRAACVAATKRR